MGLSDRRQERGGLEPWARKATWYYVTSSRCGSTPRSTRKARSKGGIKVPPAWSTMHGASSPDEPALPSAEPPHDENSARVGCAALGEIFVTGLAKNQAPSVNLGAPVCPVTGC